MHYRHIKISRPAFHTRCIRSLGVEGIGGYTPVLSTHKLEELPNYCATQPSAQSRIQHDRRDAIASINT